MRYLLTYFCVLFVFLALDATWLVLAGAALFKSQLGPLLRDQPDLKVAAAFYLIYAVGMMVLAVAPTLRDGSTMAAAWRGAVLGITAYATFDLTALSIINGWTVKVALIDLAWGTIATSVTCVIGFEVLRYFSTTDDGRSSFRVM
jgi:uncharacterized membrane protein